MRRLGSLYIALAPEQDLRIRHDQPGTEAASHQIIHYLPGHSLHIWYGYPDASESQTLKTEGEMI